jgi:hypothetical protein
LLPKRAADMITPPKELILAAPSGVNASCRDIVSSVTPFSKASSDAGRFVEIWNPMSWRFATPHRGNLHHCRRLPWAIQSRNLPTCLHKRRPRKFSGVPQARSSLAEGQVYSSQLSDRHQLCASPTFEQGEPSVRRSTMLVRREFSKPHKLP